MSANPGNIRLVSSAGEDPHDGKRAPRGLKTSSTVLATLNARRLQANTVFTKLYFGYFYHLLRTRSICTMDGIYICDIDIDM